MITPLKNPEEIKAMQAGGQRLSRILKELVAFTRPGVKLIDIEKLAWKEIIESDGKASFARVPGYKWATCLNVNEGIVHGIPTDRLIKEGDVVTIDIGIFYKGFNTDTSYTLIAQTKKVKTSSFKEKERFLEIGRKTLEEAIKQARIGQRIGHISGVIQKIVEGAGYSCIRNLTGHGVGRDLHEPPQIPCFLDRKIEETPIIEEGETLAIEIIYAMGGYTNYTKMDGWTIATSDGKISAVFEKTIAVTRDGPLILTDF